MSDLKKKLSPELTEKIARLAHLEITDVEKDKFTDQMNSILDYFDLLNEVDVTDIEPTRHAMEMTNVFRKDEAQPGLSHEEVMQNAPKKEEGYFKAPRII